MNNGEIAGKSIDSDSLDHCVDLVTPSRALFFCIRIHDVVFDFVEET
jgi:hypothetical protein